MLDNYKMVKLISIKPSSRKDKKYMALFSDGTIIHFGQHGYDDYTIHRDKRRKALYLKRHSPRENWDDFRTAGALSRWILWNRPTIDSSMLDYKKRFDL